MAAGYIIQTTIPTPLMLTAGEVLAYSHIRQSIVTSNL
jgi:hypothetical protein